MKKINNMTVFEPTDKCSLDEYSQKAATEVPELIKKAKEEVNQKVIEISENDIKQDNEIAILKTNYTNLQEQNTKLESQIKKDRENMINLEAEGQSIHIEDSSDLEGKLEVLGNVEQDVREGHNLLNNSLTNRTVNGLTVIVNKDKSVTIKGKTTANTTIKLDDTKNNNLQAGTYTLKDCQAYIESEENNGWWNGTEMAATLTFNNTPTLGNHGFYLYFSSGIAVNKTYYPQLVAGPEEKPYEQYGASPSPEHPSEIRAVGDNINLLENKAKTTTVNGVTFTANEDGAVIANGTATSLAQISLVANVKLPAGTYTIKDGKAYVESTEFNDWFDGLNNSSTLTFNTEVLLKNVYIQVKQGETVNNKIFYPKLEKGTVATSHSKFGEGSVGIKKQNKNLLENIAKTQVINGIEFTVNTDKTIKINGTATENTSIDITKNFAITEQSIFSGMCDGYGYNKMLIQIQGADYNVNITDSRPQILQPKENVKARIYIYAGTTITNALIKPQIEKGKVKTEYAEHQEQTKILPIQKPMLEGDYFVKEIDGRKEVHGWKELILNGQENTWQLYTTGTRRFGLDLTKDLPQKEIGKYVTGYCTHFKVETAIDIDLTMFLQVEPGHFYIGIVDKNSKWADVNALKSKLQELYNAGTPVTLYYKVETPTKIPCTTEQIEILDELDNFQTYKPVTNITTDSIAKLRLKYIADTKTYVDNKYNGLAQQILNLAGGNNNV